MGGVFFFVCLNFRGIFLVMVFPPLGPSLNSRNLTLNRATGITDGGRGEDVHRGVGLGEPQMAL